MPSFRVLCILSAILCFLLFCALAFFPSLIYAIFGMEGSVGADIISRRAAMLFAGISVILWQLRHLADGVAKAGLASGMVVAMAGLASVGLFEYARGQVGPGIFLAIVTEAVLLFLFLQHARPKV